MTHLHGAQASAGAVRPDAPDKPQRTPAISVRSLTKDYGGGRGIFDVTFSVERGEAFGFLGPNGAGKTTTIRNLMGFIRPDSGTTTIDGIPCFEQREEIQRTLGYLPGELVCMEDMTASAFLRLMASMKGLDAKQARIGELCERFELDTSVRIGKMSKGTKQKVGIVNAFMGRPEILLLDEPTSGLDPIMRERFIELLLEERKRGATIFLSSHIIEEVERVCDRAAFIRKGRLLDIRPLASTQRTTRRLITVRFKRAADRDAYVRAHENAAPRGTDAIELVAHGNFRELLGDLAAYPIVDLESRAQTLDEVFRNLYGITSHENEGENR